MLPRIVFGFGVVTVRTFPMYFHSFQLEKTKLLQLDRVSERKRKKIVRPTLISQVL